MLRSYPLKTLVSAKRKRTERLGVHRWHSYYAGYSEAFVSSAIEYLNLDSSHVILDPWHGSGTTSLVASRFGIATLGCEINPVMNVFSGAKTGCLIREKNDLNKILKTLVNKAFETETNIINSNDPLFCFMSSSLTHEIRNLYSIILSINYKDLTIGKPLLFIKKQKYKVFNPFKAFFLAALFITARNLGGYQGGSNPTWVKKLFNKPEISKQNLLCQYQKVVNQMIEDLELAFIPTTEEILHLPLLGDSRKLSFENDSIDAVITSPPYLTRIDYAISTKPELLIMTDEETLRSIRENSLGSPVIADKNIPINPIWGKTCLELLTNVNNHQSKAAKTYYLPNMLQYFKSVELSLSEIIRVLKPNAQALIVVQSSYFKEHEINLGQIYVELSQNLGVKSDIVSREIIRGHLAHINTKSTQYQPKKIYFEDVVSLIK